MDSTNRPAARSFVTRPHAVVAKMDTGRYVNLGTYANYFLAEPVLRSVREMPGVVDADVIINL